MAEAMETWILGQAGVSVRASADWPAYNCPQAGIKALLRGLRDDWGYTFLADLTAIDQYDSSPRYEVVYHVYHLEKGVYLRVVTPCIGDAEPRCESVVDLWATADWHERECYDMFGIWFEGHPDLRRILMWDAYPYHPLRKEFPLAGEEVELPAPDVVERTGVKVKAAPMMGGPFHASQSGTMRRREPRADDEAWTENAEGAGRERRERPRELDAGLD